MIMTKTVTKFVTEDGREFDSIEQAQAEQLVAMIPDQIKGMGSNDTTLLLQEVTGWLVDAKQSVISVLSWSVDQKPKKERKSRADKGKSRKKAKEQSELPEDQ